jgi:hypothetical protein
MVASAKIPLYFEYDASTSTPSSIAEFQASDVVSAKHGGTGVSSLAALGRALQGYNVSAKSVSALTIVAVNLSATNLSAVNVISTELSATNLSAVNVISTNLSATNLSAVNLSATTVSSTYLISSKETSALRASATYVLAESGVSAAAVSATVITGADAMPLPAPFGYVQCDTAGTNSTDMQYFASGADTTEILSNTVDIQWDDTLKDFRIMKAGTYELTGNLIVDSGAQNDILTITTRKNGAVVLTIEPRLYGNVGPIGFSIHNVLVLSVSDRLTIGIEMGSTKTAHLEAGSTMTVKRLK